MRSPVASTSHKTTTQSRMTPDNTSTNLPTDELTGTNASVTTPGTVKQKVSPGITVSDYHKKYKLRRCTVRITRLKQKSSKTTDTKQAELVLKLHRLPLKPSQIVKLKAPTSSEPVTTGTKRVISGRPQPTKHVFQMKQHVLKKRIRKLYLKCRTTNCNQAFRTFHSVRSLNVHHRIFHPKVLFRCRICPKIHRTPSAYWYHKYEHQQPTYKCT